MTLDWGSVARAIHVAAVVVWIGGVSLVTTVLLPTLKGRDDWRRDFEAVERRFAPQARIAVALVLLSGLYMLYAYDLWRRFADARFWWMHLMVAVWALFAMLLFVVEPAVARRMRRRPELRTRITIGRLLRVHRLLLALSLLAVLAAAAGSHGLF